MEKTYPPGSIGALISGHPFRVYDPYNILERWNLPADDLDAKTIGDELARAWANWSQDQRWALLYAVEALAQSHYVAERARSEPNDEPDELTRMGCDAVRLGSRIHARFTAPYDDAVIGNTMGALLDFIREAVNRSTLGSPAVARYQAEYALWMMRRTTPSTIAGGRVSWELVGKLAWLAGRRLTGGRNIQPEPEGESTIRKLVGPTQGRKFRGKLKQKPNSRIAKQWNAVWSDMCAIARAVDRHRAWLQSAANEQREQEPDNPYLRVWESRT